MQLVFLVRRISIAIVFYLVSTSGLFSQLITEPIHVFSNLPFLNSQYIKQARLNELYGTIYTKLPGEMILKTKGFVKYQFDSLGQTTSMLSYRPHLSFSDSISYYFQYSNARLTEIKALRKKDYSIQFFTYSNNKLSNTEERIGLLSTGEEIQTNSLVYVDQVIGTTNLTTISYQGGNPYKNIRRTYDELNKVSREESIDYLSQDTITTWYTYDANSNLTHKKTMAGTTLEEIVISYQSNQEVEAIKFYTNGELRNEIQLIYQAENQTLSSVICLDHRSKLMEIIRF